MYKGVVTSKSLQLWAQSSHCKASAQTFNRFQNLVRSLLWLAHQYLGGRGRQISMFGLYRKFWASQCYIVDPDSNMKNKKL